MTRPSRRLQAGLSLVELMVSITVGLMILTGVLTVFFNTSAARSEVERTNRQIENGRFAVELISTDLRLAGFFGEFDAAVGAGARRPAGRSLLARRGGLERLAAAARGGFRRRGLRLGQLLARQS